MGPLKMEFVGHTVLQQRRAAWACRHRVMVVRSSNGFRRLTDTSLTGNSIFAGIQRLQEQLALILTTGLFAIRALAARDAEGPAIVTSSSDFAP